MLWFGSDPLGHSDNCPPQSLLSISPCTSSSYGSSTLLSSGSYPIPFSYTSWFLPPLLQPLKKGSLHSQWFLLIFWILPALHVSPFYVIHLTPRYFLLLFSLLPIFLPPMNLFFHLMPVLWKQLCSGFLILVNLVMALVLVIPSQHLYHFLTTQHTIYPEDKAKNDIVISHHITED